MKKEIKKFLFLQIVLIFLLFTYSKGNSYFPSCFRRAKVPSYRLFTVKDLKGIKFHFYSGNVSISEEIPRLGEYTFSKPIRLVEKISGDFRIHLIAKLLDEFFRKTGKYAHEHILPPLIPDGRTYYYIYGEGSEIMWEEPGPFVLRGELEEFNEFSDAFSMAGFNMSADLAEVEDGRAGKNIIIQGWDGKISEEAYQEAMETGWGIFTMPPTWYRIDLDARSCPLDSEKLHNFLTQNAEQLHQVLGERKYRLIVLSCEAFCNPQEFKKHHREFNTLLAWYQNEVLKSLSE